MQKKTHNKNKNLISTKLVHKKKTQIPKKNKNNVIQSCYKC